jgi:hypothetical protein
MELGRVLVLGWPGFCSFQLCKTCLASSGRLLLVTESWPPTVHGGQPGGHSGMGGMLGMGRVGPGSYPRRKTAVVVLQVRTKAAFPIITIHSRVASSLPLTP